MNTFGISQKERLLSRISFYLLVLLVMWGTNRLVPDFDDLEAQRWESRGVARPYIAVPIAELDRILVREQRRAVPPEASPDRQTSLFSLEPSRVVSRS